jgi:L-seryl-tRNA(Ser) seleniumtransferase
MLRDLRRQLPAVDEWLSSPQGRALCAEYSRAEVVTVLREHLAYYRERLGDGTAAVPAFMSDEYAARVRADLMRRRLPSLRAAINATGIVVHTNLGRAPLAPEALAAITAVARGYSTLEIDLATGKRGSRHRHVEALLAELTGAAAGLAVNNCAAAVVLALNTVARDAEVLVSRGELIEIGGSFRMPDVIAQSGARMIEVGTTNKTTLADYRNAITANTRALLVSHPSNYRIVGFTAKPALGELAALAHERGIALIHDLGSGALVDLRFAEGVAEPTVAQSIAQGADLVLFSGDKLLGGPQAGLVVGRADLIEALKRNPLARALRIDKLSLAALAATLALYRPPHDPRERIPVLRMLSEPKASVARRAARIARELRKNTRLMVELGDDVSYAGGGALPLEELPTRIVRLRALDMTVTELVQRLRVADPPVIARIVDNAVILDPRTVPTTEIPKLLAAIAHTVT